MPEYAVFLDRDGTINEDPGYLGDPDLVKLLPGVAEGIAELKNKFKFKIVVVSNQSGISRELITEEDVKKVNNKINELLNDAGTAIDAFYYCPYHPKFNGEEKAKCRKPSPFMIYKARDEMNIDLNSSYMAGDRATDVLCGINAGVKTILINSNLTGDEINLLKKEGKSANFVACDFRDTVKYITDDFTRRISY